jgi:hypothetical protein
LEDKVGHAHKISLFLLYVVTEGASSISHLPKLESKINHFTTGSEYVFWS